MGARADVGILSHTLRHGRVILRSVVAPWGTSDNSLRNRLRLAFGLRVHRSYLEGMVGIGWGAKGLRVRAFPSCSHLDRFRPWSVAFALHVAGLGRPLGPGVSRRVLRRVCLFTKLVLASSPMGHTPLGYDRFRRRPGASAFGSVRNCRRYLGARGRPGDHRRMPWGMLGDPSVARALAARRAIRSSTLRSDLGPWR